MLKNKAPALYYGVACFWNFKLCDIFSIYCWAAYWACSMPKVYFSSEFLKLLKFNSSLCDSFFLKSAVTCLFNWICLIWSLLESSFSASRAMVYISRFFCILSLWKDCIILFICTVVSSDTALFDMFLLMLLSWLFAWACLGSKSGVAPNLLTFWVVFRCLSLSFVFVNCSIFCSFSLLSYSGIENTFGMKLNAPCLFACFEVFSSSFGLWLIGVWNSWRATSSSFISMFSFSFVFSIIFWETAFCWTSPLI